MFFLPVRTSHPRELKQKRVLLHFWFVVMTVGPVSVALWMKNRTQSIFHHSPTLHHSQAQETVAQKSLLAFGRQSGDCIILKAFF